MLAKSERTDDQYRYQRSYPGGAAYANLTGYFSLRYPPTQIERSQDDLLSGESADLLVDRVGDFLTGRDPRGGSVELTVIPTVQQVAYDELVSRGLVGTVVAMRPQTGEILAMATTPSFDPNPLADHSDSVQRDAFNALHTLPEGQPSPVDDRAIDLVYPPGSTFKLVVASAALMQGYDPQTPLTGASSLDPARHQRGAAAELRRGELRRRRRRHRLLDHRARALLQHRVRRARHGARRGRAPPAGRGVRRRRQRVRPRPGQPAPPAPAA